MYSIVAKDACLKRIVRKSSTGYVKKNKVSDKDYTICTVKTIKKFKWNILQNEIGFKTVWKKRQLKIWKKKTHRKHISGGESVVMTRILLLLLLFLKKNSCLIILFSRPVGFLPYYYYFLFFPSSTQPWVAAREANTTIVCWVVVIKTAANVFHNSRRPLIIISTGLCALLSPQFFIAIVLLSLPLQTSLSQTIGDLIKTRGV